MDTFIFQQSLNLARQAFFLYISESATFLHSKNHRLKEGEWELSLNQVYLSVQGSTSVVALMIA